MLQRILKTCLHLLTMQPWDYVVALVTALVMYGVFQDKESDSINLIFFSEYLAISLSVSLVKSLIREIYEIYMTLQDPLHDPEEKFFSVTAFKECIFMLIWENRVAFVTALVMYGVFQNKESDSINQIFLSEYLVVTLGVTLVGKFLTPRDELETV